MTTRALATFGVYGRPSDAEIETLALADEFRADLCALYQERHEQIIDYRNRRFPSLFAALGEADRAYWTIADIERQIKAHHSDVRDRNAVTPEQQAELAAAREWRKEANTRVVSERKKWSEHLRAFGQFWKNAADWKNMKSLDKRRHAYAGLAFPDEFREYGELHVALDLRERELYRRYQDRGLNSAIRAEIVEASQPKLKKDAPGIRYHYGRAPEPNRWQKLSLHFVGGLTFGEAIEGTPILKITPVYTNHPTGGDECVVSVRQQIGTAEKPRAIEYTCKLDKPIDPETRMQRWSLVVRESGKREIIPICAGIAAKPTGEGAFTFRLSWTRRAAGIEVAHFWGAHVNERLVIPNWIVARRMGMAEEQQAADRRANILLEARGISPSKKPGELQGLAALNDYCAKHPMDNAAYNALDFSNRTIGLAQREAQRAMRCIEDIYKMVASRLCRLHDAVCLPNINLVKLKRYSTRDLLKEDVVPEKSREYMHAVAPGKLKALIEGWGLASADVDDPPPDDARNTDVFTTYVLSLGRKTGTKVNQPCRRSQEQPQDVKMPRVRRRAVKVGAQT